MSDVVIAGAARTPVGAFLGGLSTIPAHGLGEIAIIEAGKVLLIKRRDFAVWALPGGGIDAGESAAEAAVREAQEETGLEVELLHLVGVYSRPAWCQGGDHDLLFAARPVGGELVREGDETLDASFFAPDALPEPLVYWYPQRIADVLAGMRGIARQRHHPLALHRRDDPGRPQTPIGRRRANTGRHESLFRRAWV